MSTTRLRARIPAAEPIGAARIEGYQLVCNKRGKDGSGKANLIAASNAGAWGVLFQLTQHDWATLDRFEWGYARSSCRVSCNRGVGHEAQLYLALAPADREIPPYDWYRDHCLAGAREHALPSPVIEAIANWTVELGAR